MLWLQNSAHIWSLSPNMHNVNILEVGLVPKAKSTGQCNYFNPIHDWFHETVHFQTTFLHSYFFHMKSSALPFLNFLFWANFKLQKSYKNSIEFSCILHQLLLMLTFQVTMVQWAKLDLTRHLPPLLECPRIFHRCPFLLFQTQPRILCWGSLCCCVLVLCSLWRYLPSLLISHESNTLGGAGELFYRWSLNLSDAFMLWLMWSFPGRNPAEWPCLPSLHSVRGCDVNRPCSWAVHQDHLHKKFLPGSLSLQWINILG